MRWPRYVGLASFPLLALLGVWIGWSANQVRLRREVIDRVEMNGGSIVPPRGRADIARAASKLPWMWRMCGAEPVEWVLLPDRGFKSDDASESTGASSRVRRLFPEAEVAPISQTPRAE